MGRESGGNLASGLLAAAVGTGSLATLFTAGKRGAENLSLFVSNITNASKTFDVQVLNAAGTITGYLCKGVTLTANCLPVELGIPTLKQGDVIKVLGSDANVSFVLFAEGFE